MERLLKFLLITAMVLSTAASFALERCACAHVGAGAPPAPLSPAVVCACCCPAPQDAPACTHCAAECNHRPPSGDNAFTMDLRRYSYRELKIQQADRPHDAPRSSIERIGAYLVLNSRVSSAPPHLASTVLLI